MDARKAFDLHFVLPKRDTLLAGFDEVGRGPLAGPVVGVCAIIAFEKINELKNSLKQLVVLGADDSKKLSAKSRARFCQSLGINVDQIGPGSVFQGNISQLWLCLSEVSEKVIDRINILEASHLCLKKSFKIIKNQLEKSLNIFQGSILVDGIDAPKLYGKTEQIRMYPIIKGDTKSVIIGTASIIAKEYRDLLATSWEKQYPGYGFATHKGYPTKRHQEAIERLGPLPIHRQSFKGVKEYV